MSRGQKPVDVMCKLCGKPFKAQVSELKSGRGKYCSKPCANIGTSTKSIIPCAVCGNPIAKRPSNPDKKYCSRRCFGIANRGIAKRAKNGENRPCEWCGKEIYVQHGKLDKHNFCSHKCQVHYFLPQRTGENSASYKGGTSILKDKSQNKEYILILGTGRGKMVREHREIAEQVLGRKLTKNEIVHHVDGNGLNNNHDNLVVCSRSYHALIHHRTDGGLFGRD